MVLGVDVPQLPSFSLPGLKAAFQTGFVFELYDTREANPIDQHVFVLNPRRYTLTEPFQSTLTPTEADLVVEETNGIVVREIQLEGTFGLKKRSPQRFSSSGQSDKDGSEQFALLRKLFRKYSRLKQQPTLGPYTKLVFHSLRDNDHFVVVPRSFETPRDAKTTRLHYEYRISMFAIAEWKDGIKLKAIKDRVTITDVLRAVNQAISNARGFLSDVNQFKAAIKRKIANIDAILINIEGLIEQAGLAFGSPAGSNAINYPFERVLQLADEIETIADTFEASFLTQPTFEEAQAGRAMRKLGISIGSLLQYPDRFRESSQDSKRRIERAYLGEKTLTDEDIETGSAGATAGSATRVQRGTEQDAGVNYGSARSLRRVPVDVTTTLESLSSRFNVEPELIVITNNLKPPYFSASGLPGTLRPGEFVLVPEATGQGDRVSLSVASQRYADPALVLYGADLALDPNELAAGRLDIRENLTHGADDAELVSGVANVEQGLAITLRTERGETQFLPDVGISSNVGSKGTLANVVLGAISLQNAILEDDRIEEILEASVTLEDDVLSHTVTPLLRGSQEKVEIVLPFGRATGG